MPTSQILSPTKDIGAIISAIGELPASPAIVAGVMNLTSDLNSDIDALGKLIMSDQVLTAKVLKLSNSTFYGRHRQVSKIREAIVILGFHTIRSLVLASSVRYLYKKMDTDKIESCLWAHSVSTAMGCRLVANSIKHSMVEEAFISGILHDIGKLILFHKFPQEYSGLINTIRETKIDFHLLENQTFGFNHVQVGSGLLMKWNFPELFIDSIQNHHLWQERNQDDRHLPLSWIIKYASIISSRLGLDFREPNLCENELKEAAEKIGISEERSAKLSEQILTSYNQEGNLYK